MNRRADTPALYLVTDRHATGGRSLVDVVTAALRGGPPDRIAVQLREKDMEGRELVALARALRAVTGRARLFINDRLDVALAAGADGVHLRGDSLSPAEARSVSADLQIAVSAHSADEVVSALERGAAFALFGPVFATPSKRALGEPQGLAALAAVGARVRGAAGVVAIGGVNVHNAAACIEAGATGVACISAVMAASDPEAAVQDFFRVFSRS